MNNTLALGKFGAVHGVTGWIKVYSFTEPGKNIFNYPDWHVKVGHTWQQHAVQARKTQQDHFLVKLTAINTPEEARRLVNCQIHTDVSNLPKLPSGEYYWHELDGLTVINQDGTIFGKVDHLINTGANDILCVINEQNHERLIPYIPGVISTVDLEKNQILVNWDPEF